MKRYTKAEVKVIKNLEHSDAEVAKMLNRTERQIYYKRWYMKLIKKAKPAEKKKTLLDTINKIVVGKMEIHNVVTGIEFDFEKKTLTINTK